MNAPSKLAKFPGIHPTPGLPEIESLLEVVHMACLLVERRTGRILLANTQASELTAFTRVEFAGMPLTNVIDGTGETDPWASPSGQPFPTPLRLKKRNGTKVEVQTTRIDLVPRSKWSLIAFEEIAKIQSRLAREQRRADMLVSMQTISQALSQPDLDSALKLVLQAGREITRSDIASVYLPQLGADGQNYELVQNACLGAEGVFPDRMPGQETVLLRAAQFWSPGKRPATSLHRAARANNLAALATAPLGQKDAAIGILVIGAGSELNPEATLAQLHILSGVVSSIIQFHAHASNLEAALDEQMRVHAADKVGVDAVSEGIIVLTPTLTITRMNPAAEAILGYSSHEAHGHPVSDILIGTAALDPALQIALQGVPTLNQDNIRLYRRTGQPFLAQVSILPAMAQGDLEGLVVLIQDLSEQEQIQAQAQQLEQRALLGEVTGVFAHEVRDPINSISTGLQFMALNLPDDDPHQPRIARMQQECDRLGELMKSVLAFSRPAAYEMGAVDIKLLLSRLLDRLKPRMVQVEVQSFLKDEPPIPPVKGNFRALEQVFTNLLTNAIQAMSEKGGMLAVKIHKVDGPGGHDVVVVNVADTGPGIPKEYQERLFQPFFTTKSDGTGLGLAITKRILTAHKGNIQVTSQPGSTVFQVQLPALESS